jgi:1-acyl-sn-glycerol-3-phosphate acyltransferase
VHVGIAQDSRRIAGAWPGAVGHLRAWLRIGVLLGVSLAIGAAGLGARALTLVLPALAQRTRTGLSRAWACAVARIVGMRVRVDGEPPTRPCLLVANHLSYVDVVALWTATHGAFIAKSEVAAWPLVGRLGAVMQTLFIDRGRKRDLLRVLGEMERRLAGGESVILFAEGTSSRGERVLPFKSSLFEAAVRAGLPVACASVGYATPSSGPPADLAVCWWGDMTFADHVYALLRLPHFEATLRFAPEPLAGPERKALARQAHRAVAARFVPVTAG